MNFTKHILACIGIFGATCALMGASTDSHFRPLAAASKHFSRFVAAARAAEDNPYVKKPTKTKISLHKPYEIPLLFNEVSNLIKLGERRASPEAVYGAYMLENLRGRDGQGNPAPLYKTQDRLFSGEVFGNTMFAVADGHGDHGDKIADQIMKTIPLQVLNSSDIQEGFKKACKALQIKFLKSSYAQYSGSTFLAGVIRDKMLTVANVGDSRLLVIRPSQGIVFSTTDHKATLAEYTQRGHALGRTLGDVACCTKWGLSSHPDITQVKLMDDDYLVLASDGYWDVVSNKETCDFIVKELKNRTGRSCKDMAEMLGQEARKRASIDDISVLVVRYCAGTSTAVTAG